jgi:hypothetical protein
MAKDQLQHSDVHIEGEQATLLNGIVDGTKRVDLSTLSTVELKALRAMLDKKSEKNSLELKPARMCATYAGGIEKAFGATPQMPEAHTNLANLSREEAELNSLKQKVSTELGIDDVDGLMFNEATKRYEVSSPNNTFSVISSLKDHGYAFERDTHGSMKVKRGDKEAIVYFGPQVEAIVNRFGGAFDRVAKLMEQYRNVTDVKKIPSDVRKQLEGFANEIANAFKGLGVKNVALNENGFGKIELFAIIALAGIGASFAPDGNGLLGALGGVGLYVGYKLLPWKKFAKDQYGKGKEKAGAFTEKEQQKAGAWMIDNPKATWGIIGVIAAGVIALAVAKSCGDGEDGDANIRPDFSTPPPVVETDTGGEKNAPKNDGTVIKDGGSGSGTDQQESIHSSPDFTQRVKKFWGKI